MPSSKTEHYYLSTACLHQLHSYCQAAENECGEEKEPGQCKFCASACICPCHRDEPIPMLLFRTPE